MSWTHRLRPNSLGPRGAEPGSEATERRAVRNEPQAIREPAAARPAMPLRPVPGPADWGRAGPVMTRPPREPAVLPLSRRVSAIPSCHPREGGARALSFRSERTFEPRSDAQRGPDDHRARSMGVHGRFFADYCLTASAGQVGMTKTPQTGRAGGMGGSYLQLSLSPRSASLARRAHTSASFPADGIAVDTSGPDLPPTPRDFATEGNGAASPIVAFGDAMPKEGAPRPYPANAVGAHGTAHETAEGGAH